MKLYNYFIQICLVASLVLTSCDDWLGVESENTQTIDSFYKTPGQMDQALNGIYNGLLPLPTYTMLMSEFRSDNFWIDLSNDAQRDYIDLGSFNPNISNISTLDNAWKDLYEIVARANAFLSKAGNVKFISEEIKQQYIAEAHFLRALAYFDLVRYFGRIPMVTVPLSPKEAATIGQSEAKDVYEQVIVPDLQFAVEHLPLKPLTYLNKAAAAGRANLIAAKSLLGRVYLTMAGFPLNDTSKKEQAKILFEEVIDYACTNNKYWAKTGEEWKRIWISDNDNKYHIFEVQYIIAADLGNPMVCETCPNLYSAYTKVPMAGNRAFCEDQLNEMLKKNIVNNEYQDIRCLATIDTTKFVNTDGNTPVKYTNPDFFIKFVEHKMKRAALGYSDIDNQIVDRKYWPINFPIIRLEDVMLMYAEIVGPTTKGLQMLNDIRIRAGLDAISEGCTVAEFQEYVANERRVELACEGIRWHDLVRHNNLKAIKDMFMRYATNMEGQVDVNIASYADRVKEGTHIYPIPESQMRVKEGLYQQNEAYR